MIEIELKRRYPNSDPKDITDAYMRGVEFERESLLDEIDDLHEAIHDLWPLAEFKMTERNREGWIKRLRGLGCEVGS